VRYFSRVNTRWPGGRLRVISPFSTSNSTTQVSNGWLGESLQMGRATAVSQYVGLFRKAIEQGSRPHLLLIERLET
jgi:hypothetical protein